MTDDELYDDPSNLIDDIIDSRKSVVDMNVAMVRFCEESYEAYQFFVQKDDATFRRLFNAAKEKFKKILERGDYEWIPMERIKEIVMNSSVGMKLNPKRGFHLVLMDWLRATYGKHYRAFNK